MFLLLCHVFRDAEKNCHGCRFDRGLKKRHVNLIKRLRKVKKETAAGDKPEPVRTHLRNMIVIPEMIGSIIGVYNGKTFNQASIFSTHLIPILPRHESTNVSGLLVVSRSAWYVDLLQSL